jgi:hypothetical protein
MCFRTLESQPVTIVSETDPRPFVQFNVFYSKNGTTQRIIGFGHPDLIHLLHYYRANLSIDRTFSITPSPFKQTLIVMVYDPTYDLYVRVLYVLVQVKDEWTFWHVLQWVQVLGRMRMTTGSVTCDFELALVRGIRDQFPNSRMIGCLFHWKEAIRRKLVDLRIPANQIRVAMTTGVMDTLTVIPIDEIISKGIPFGPGGWERTRVGPFLGVF